MSNWADLLDDDEPSPTPHGGDPEPAAPLSDETIRTARRIQALRAARTECLERQTWTLDGPEPPPHVVRLRVVEDTGTYLARKPLTSDGEPNGWWWVNPDEAADGRRGWSWPREYPWLLEQHFPPITATDSEFTRSLALALPRDGEWYQIGISPLGPPVWAYCLGSSRSRWGLRWGLTVSDHYPDEVPE